MIPWIGELLLPLYGPFRLMGSRLLLTGLGATLTALLAWRLLPKLWHLLPRDAGRPDAIGAAESVGKPVGAGIVFVALYLAVCFLVIPYNLRAYELLACMALAMIEGFADDRSAGGWSEARLGIVDLIISVLGAVALCQLRPMEIWLPLLTTPLLTPVWIYLPIATGMIWLSINATNCTDGVDGLSGSLSVVALFYLGIILYGIVGHPVVAEYLKVPHYTDAASDAMLAFIMMGSLAGYLWHNAQPSAVLMGDAGSRPIGFLLGALVMGTGNPVLIVVVAGVVLANGATGLLKLALLRFFKIGIFRAVRYPLHDHARKNLGWSNPQVLLRFILLQALATPILLVLILKIR